MYFREENNPKYIKKLFARKFSISAYGGIKKFCLKKSLEFSHFQNELKMSYS